MPSAGRSSCAAARMCGATGDIGLISGITDSAVASGVRRLEALTGKAARKAANHVIEVAKTAAAELKTPLDEMPQRVGQIMDERKRLERELFPDDAKKKLAMGGGAKSDSADGVRRSATSSCSPAPVEGIDVKDSKASPTKARSRSAPASSSSSASPRRARPGSWSASPADSRRASPP